MNAATNHESRFMNKGRRKRKPVRPAADRQSLADRDEEWLVRTLLEKIELAVDECWVWPY
jgi:hypothetical protein